MGNAMSVYPCDNEVAGDSAVSCPFRPVNLLVRIYEFQSKQTVYIFNGHMKYLRWMYMRGDFTACSTLSGASGLASF